MKKLQTVKEFLTERKEQKEALKQEKAVNEVLTYLDIRYKTTEEKIAAVKKDFSTKRMVLAGAFGTIVSGAFLQATVSLFQTKDIKKKHKITIAALSGLTSAIELANIKKLEEPIIKKLKERNK